jgi:hypothetical protein
MVPEVAAALIGGAGSLIGSGIDAYSAYKERKEAAKRRKAANEQLSSWESQANAILDAAMRDNVKLTDANDVKRYRQMRSSYDPSSYVYDFEPFEKDIYRVEDYLNPNKDAILADVAKTAQHTAAGAGLGHSSGAMEAINQAIINKDEELYDKAWDRMNTERNFDYGAYTDFINQKQQQLQNIQSGILNQMNLMRGDIQFDQQQQDALTANRLNLGNTIAQTRAQLV